MKRGRFSDEQIVRILREADKEPVSEVTKRHGVSEPTIYAWRKKFGDMETDEVARLKAMEVENTRLRKLFVDRDLEIEVMKEINRKKWKACRSDWSRHATQSTEGFRNVGHAICWTSRVLACTTISNYLVRMRQSLMQCVACLASFRASVHDEFGCFWRGKAWGWARNAAPGFGPMQVYRFQRNASAGGPLPAQFRARRCRANETSSGAMISCLTPVPTGRY